MTKILFCFCVILHIILANGFINIFTPKIFETNIFQSNNCNERIIYKNYLIGLRKTRRYIRNSTNINTLSLLVNYTNNFISNFEEEKYNSINLNNTLIGVKTITMGNVNLDVSNIKEIHIETRNDKLVIQLDKNKQNNNILNILEKINNIDTLINTLSFLNHLINLN